MDALNAIVLNNPGAHPLLRRADAAFNRAGQLSCEIVTDGQIVPRYEEGSGGLEIIQINEKTWGIVN